MTGTNPSTNRGAEVNHRGAAQRRAESFYLVYAALGPSRSLTKLQKILGELGVRISANTLKGYSARYNWQHRAELVDGAHTAVELANVPVEMDDRHARLGAAMQALAFERLQTLDLADITMADAVRLIKVGVDVERLARGQATTKAELTVQMLDPLIRELAALFAEVNVIEDPAIRATVWADKADGILEVYAPRELLSKNR